MPIRLAVPKETDKGERRVAVVPDIVARLVKQGYELCVETGAGAGAYYTDEVYQEAGATIVSGKKELYANAEIILKVLPPSEDEIGLFKPSSILICFLQPQRHLGEVTRLRDGKVTSFAMELVPRISRAQSMDALSSQGTAVGYQAVLIAADMSKKFFPMLTTAAGTIRPAKVLVLGAGVAGLQAIATARRLGAIVEAYDVRRAAREQVESLGAKFLQVEMDAEAEGGYARELTDEEKEREQAMLWRSVCDADVVITTAQIPGREAPRLISAKMVDDMKPGAVIVDLAAESGGNCELSEAGKQVEHKGVLIEGPVNMTSKLSVHASDMYAKNLFNFISLFSQDGDALTLDWEDEILVGSAVTHDGQIRHEETRQLIEGTQS